MIAEWLIAAETFGFGIIGLNLLKNKCFDGSKVETTTNLPMSIISQTCHHEWEEDKHIIEGDFQTKLIIINKCHQCGTIDKTIELVDKKCKHRFNTEQYEVRSAFEQRYTKGDFNAPEPKTANAWMFKKEAKIVRTCNLCGFSDKIDLSNLPDAKITG